jgi:hypothetical protein
MGGGPSREERRATELAQQQAAAAERRAQEAFQLQRELFTTARQPNPVQERQDAAQIAWLDAIGGKNGPFDATKLEGMAPSYNFFNKAKGGQEAERMGQGLISMGAANAHPGFSEGLRQQRAGQAAQDAAGNFENAFSAKHAEMTGSAIPLIGLRQSNNMGLLGAAGGMAGQAMSGSSDAMNTWLQLLTRPRPPSFGQQLAQGAIGGAMAFL